MQEINKKEKINSLSYNKLNINKDYKKRKFMFGKKTRNNSCFFENKKVLKISNDMSQRNRFNKMKKDLTEEKNKINNMINDRYFKLNEPSSLNIKPLSNSLSTKTINYENRRSEITNPELYYKRNNEDYYKYRTEMKQYLDYNYKILSNKDRLNKKQEVNINPYNPLDADFEHYKSDLPHNPILNPVNNYSFNKYLEKEIKDIKMHGNNPDSNYNNINKKNTPSTFQQVGNYLINK